MMERGEPSLVPEWYKPANGASAAAAAADHSHNTGLSPHSDHRRSATTSRVSASSRDVPRSSSFGDRVGASSNGSKDSHPYSNFGRSRRDRERDVESRGRDRVRDRKSQIDDRFYGRLELYNANSKDKDRSRRSQSMEPGRQIESRVKKSGNGVRNGVVSGPGGIGGISRASFDRDFPSLGPELPDRVSSPGIATVVPCTPTSSLPVIRADGWTSALVDVSAPQTPTAMTCLKLAEALAQEPGVHTPPQLSKDEELARRQSKLLILVTPSMPKTLTLSAQKTFNGGVYLSNRVSNTPSGVKSDLLAPKTAKPGGPRMPTSPGGSTSVTSQGMLRMKSSPASSPSTVPSKRQRFETCMEEKKE